jgi:hypothetical protein
MKKIILFLSITAMALAGRTQVTITSADFGSIGDVVFNGTDTSVSAISPGAAGAGQTWDFRSLYAEFLDTIYFVDPASTPNGSDFPGSNLATSSEEGVAYLNKGGSDVKIEGIVGTFGTFATGVITYNPPQKSIIFPASMGSSFTSPTKWTSTSYYPIGAPCPTGGTINVDSVRLVRHSDLAVNYDGWGNLRIPIGDFNALRAAGIEYILDSIFVYTSNTCPPFINSPGWNFAPSALTAAYGYNNPNYDTIRTYSWYANGEKFAICGFTMRSNGQVAVASFKTDPLTFGIDPGNGSQITLRTFPNPTSDVVQFDGKILPNSTVTVFDSFGRMVMISHMNEKPLVDVTSIAAGVYSFVISKDHGTYGRGKFLVVR